MFRKSLGNIQSIKGHGRKAAKWWILGGQMPQLLVFTEEGANGPLGCDSGSDSYSISCTAASMVWKSISMQKSGSLSFYSLLLMVRITQKDSIHTLSLSLLLAHTCSFELSHSSQYRATEQQLSNAL